MSSRSWQHFSSRQHNGNSRSSGRNTSKASCNTSSSCSSGMRSKVSWSIWVSFEFVYCRNLDSASSKLLFRSSSKLSISETDSFYAKKEENEPVKCQFLHAMTPPSISNDCMLLNFIWLWARYFLTVLIVSSRWTKLSAFFEKRFHSFKGGKPTFGYRSHMTIVIATWPSQFLE